MRLVMLRLIAAPVRPLSLPPVSRGIVLLIPQASGVTRIPRVSWILLFLLFL